MLFQLLVLGCLLKSEPPATMSVDATRPGARISPDLYGVFFEEINCAGDGGLYAEMVRNRSFEEAATPVHWQASTGARHRADADVVNIGEPRRNVLRLQDGSEISWISNSGYWGMSVNAGAAYRLEFKASTDMGAARADVSLESPTGEVLGTAKVEGIGEKWKLCVIRLRASKSEKNAKLVIRPRYSGTLWIDDVSLFPEITFRSRRNGLRPDLAAMLQDLKPAFLRFPGGCWVEGETMAGALRWKQTIGPWERRRSQPNLWGYTSSNGLGYHEYLQLCEDLRAAPLFVINCGMSHRENVPMAAMGEFVQDALDAIEYANGPTTSTWGALRATNGHPESFGLKYLEIGNENGGPAYAERFELIARAVKSRYPEIRIIAGVWRGFPKSAFAEILDEHYYSNPEFFFENADKYDRYDRAGPKIYVGEYACTEGVGGGNAIAALAEAAFMTGMERNADVVTMSSYAPLFANVNHKRWNPDLINFDGSRVYGTPSYYVQQMFSQNRGDRVLPMTIRQGALPKSTFPAGRIGVGTWDTQAEFKDVRVTATDGSLLLDSHDGSGLGFGLGRWSASGGSLKQSSRENGARASAGQLNWQGYSVSLRARKTGGAEGFLITVGMADEQNWIWWNIGGWGNSRHAIERSLNGSKSRVGAEVEGRIETNRWYDVRVEYLPERIRCFLDGKLIQDVPCPQRKTLFGTSSRDEKTGEVIVKIVHRGDKPKVMNFVLPGLTGVYSGTVTTLTAPSADAENSLDNPKNVIPTSTKVTGMVPRFEVTLPPLSVSIFRLRRQN